MTDTSEEAIKGALEHASGALPHLAGPLVTDPWLRALVVVAGFALTMMLSGPLVRFFIFPRGGAPASPARKSGRFDSGAVIGKCENILALLFILSGELTALSLIFAAKSLVRSEEMRKEPGYFLVGFLVNFVWSVLMGFLIRLLVVGV